MLSAEDEEELKGFEARVDEVMGILNLMQSNVKKDSEAAIDMADKFLNGTPGLKDINIDECIVRVTKDRTVINKNASDPPEETSPATMDQKAFMATVEADAKRRFRERKEREKIAQGLRKVGNQAFRNGEFEKAVNCYSKAIDQIRDCPQLYNNRALAYIRLELYKRAIIDCDFVLDKLDDKNLRAWLYRAKGYHCLGEDRNYERSIAEAKKLNPKDVAFIEDIVANIEGEKLMPESDTSSEAASDGDVVAMDTN
ncbi:tetratricopeptide repeat protein 12 [Culicoides brevitarsis]|uniref:tetratricopeptide repeat protein 12 n=1 Tax=Culicoides brevitarsis TaxID=469753 RepID=UPI00307BA690